MASLGELSASSLNRPRAQEGAPIDDFPGRDGPGAPRRQGQAGSSDDGARPRAPRIGAEVGAEGSPDDRDDDGAPNQPPMSAEA